MNMTCDMHKHAYVALGHAHADETARVNLQDHQNMDSGVLLEAQAACCISRARHAPIPERCSSSGGCRGNEGPSFTGARFALVAKAPVNIWPRCCLCHGRASLVAHMTCKHYTQRDIEGLGESQSREIGVTHGERLG
jgi:hypothetical protein